LSVGLLCPTPGQLCNRGPHVRQGYVRLTDDGGNPLSNEPIVFDFCHGRVQQAAYTDSNGIAGAGTLWCTDNNNITVLDGAGPGVAESGTARFPGDATYAPSTASWTLGPIP
jgi:hypothetical protein